MRQVMLILSVLAPVACTTVQPIVDYRAAEKHELCSAYQLSSYGYGKESDSKALAEIERRMKTQPYRPVDYEVLRSRKLIVGVHRNVVQCVMHLPDPEYSGSTSFGDYENYRLSQQDMKDYGVEPRSGSSISIHFSDSRITQIHHNSY